MIITVLPPLCEGGLNVTSLKASTNRCVFEKTPRLYANNPKKERRRRATAATTAPPEPASQVRFRATKQHLSSYL